VDKTLNDLVENCTTFTCHRLGVTMHVPQVYHMAAVGMYFGEVIADYLRIIERRLRKIEYIVDVGAHVGLWTVAFAVHFPGADILAIEPSKYSFGFLRQNTEKYASRIETKKLALGNKAQNVTISLPTQAQKRQTKLRDTGQISVYGLDDYCREIVPMDTLDNIVSRKVDWIKIDVEGAEKLVLLGAEKTIAKDRPILQVEMRDINQSMAHESVWDLLEYITNGLGYWSIGELRGDLIFIPREYANTTDKSPD